MGMNKELKKIQFEELFFVLFLSAEILIESNVTIGRAAFRGVELVSLAALIVIELVSHHTYSAAELLAIAIIVLFGFQVILHGGLAIFLMAAVAFCLRHKKIERLAIIMVYTIVAWTVAVVLLCNIGIIDDVVVQPTSLGRQERYSMGFAWPSKIQTLLLSVACLYFLAKKKESLLSGLMVLCLAAWYCFEQTNVRYSFYMLLIVVIAGLLLKHVKSGSVGGRIWALVLSSCFVIGCIVSFYLALHFDPSEEFWVKINNLLSGRLDLTVTAIENRTLTLFGDVASINQATADSTQFGYLDCGYLNALYCYGIIPFSVIIACLTYALYRCARLKQYYEVLCFLVFAVTSVFYSHMLYTMPYSIVAFITLQSLLSSKYHSVITKEQSWKGSTWLIQPKAPGT